MFKIAKNLKFQVTVLSLLHQFVCDKDLHAMLEYNKGIFVEGSFLMHLKASYYEKLFNQCFIIPHQWFLLSKIS